MRGDQRLERDKPDARRRCSARFGTGLALALVLTSAAASAADRPDLRYPEADASLPAPAPPPPLLTTPAETPAPGELRLIWFDPQHLFPPAFDSASREVSRIFGSVGVRIHWERGDAGTNFGDRGGLEIPVILLGDDPSAARSPRRVMGLVPRPSDGPRVVWVFLSSVRWTLGQNPRSSQISSPQAHELGLALARVVAHEVIHAVAPEEPHTTSGLMHHSMDRTFLLGPRAVIDPECAHAFVRRLDELLAPNPAPAVARMGAATDASAP